MSQLFYLFFYDFLNYSKILIKELNSFSYADKFNVIKNKSIIAKPLAILDMLYAEI